MSDPRAGTDGGRQRRPWSHRLTLALWRLFPARVRERHRRQVAETLARIDEEPPHRRRPPTTRDAAFRGAALVADAVATLLAAWSLELVGEGRRHARRGSGSSPPPGRNSESPPARRTGLADALARDMRLAFRALRRAPGFTVTAALTLGLGIGATTTFFSAVHGVVLRALPYPEPDRLVTVQEYRVERGIPLAGSASEGISYPNFLDLRAGTGVFESMAATRYVTFLLLGAEEPVEVLTGAVEPELFEVLGVPPAMGRTIRPDDRDVTVLSDGLWRDLFGADPGIVGRTISLGRRPFQVVGVMPPEFLAHDDARLWVPLDDTTATRLDERGWRVMEAHARLAPGVTLEEARAAMEVVADRLADEHADTGEGWRLWIYPLHAEVVGDAGSTLGLLLGAVAVLLLIACANVANLQLGRLAGARREIALRHALGAGRGRIVQQLLVESLALATLGGAVGTVLAFWGVRAFVALAPADVPRLEQVGLDLQVLAFTLAVSVLTGVVFGLVPALRGAGGDLRAALQEDARGSGPGRGARRLRSGLLAGELALAVILVGGAGLVTHGFLYLWTYDPGFDPSNVLTFRLRMWTPDGPPGEASRYGDLAAQDAFLQQVYDRLETLPGVEAVGGANRLPTGRLDFVGAVIPDGRPDEQIRLRFRPISGDYLAALRVPLLAGRALPADATTEVVLNESAAESIWPGVAPAAVVGRRVEFPPIRGLADQPPEPWREVVGVVGDVRHGGVAPEPRPELYHAHREGGFVGIFYVVVRTRTAPLEIVPAVREAVWSLDPEAPIDEIRTLEEVIAGSMERPRFYAFLFSLFGVLALALAAAGVAGVAAWSVARRAHEIGVRMALGAGPRAVLGLVMGQGLLLIGVGMAVGLAAALALAGLLEGFVHGVDATDPATLAGACAVLAAVAVVAMAVPARRATRVDPVAVLRRD